MSKNRKDIALLVFFRCFQGVGAAVALSIPAILAYKLARGASWLTCLSIFVAYLNAFVSTMFLLVRTKRLDAVWGSLFGLSFFALLFFSLRL